MDNQLYHLASLSVIDAQLDLLDEEYGDLPEEIEKQKEKAEKLASMVEETEKIYAEVQKFLSKSSTNLQAMKNKEEELSKRQFQVRNNKEFDAITKEIEHVRSEYATMVEETRKAGLNRENLEKVLGEQKKQLTDVKALLEEKEKELESITGDQDEELKDLKEKKAEIREKINKDLLVEYKRIRGQFHDAVVKVRKNSCSGCFSSMPPQKIVEMRNNLDTIYYCENCGRILYPEELGVDETIAV